MLLAGSTHAYSAYAETLQALLDEQGHDLPPADLANVLDGSGSALRDLVSLDHRRTLGAFFTGPRLRGRVAEALSRYELSGPFMDPTCGAGDLLLAAVGSLPTAAEPGQTVHLWSDELYGTDTQPTFVEVASARLRLLARLQDAERFPIPKPADLVGGDADLGPFFKNLVVRDGLAALQEAAPFRGTVLINPPFGSVSAPDGCRWGAGLVPRAALFTSAAVEALAPGSAIVAILPDVLRSGARLRKWRMSISEQSEILDVQILGQFDEHADVDVFMLVARKVEDVKPRLTQDWATNDVSGTETIGKHFEVRVGSVVDNRDPLEGDVHPYVTARSLPPRGAVDSITLTRRFAGTLRKPPFVLIRRTSRPSQGNGRAHGVLITGEQSVAVDNHLLIALPRDGSVVKCETLLDVLSSEQTTEYLDERIRCRHLTVGALAEVPWNPVGAVSSQHLAVIADRHEPHFRQE